MILPIFVLGRFDDRKKYGVSDNFYKYLRLYIFDLFTIDTLN